MENSSPKRKEALRIAFSHNWSAYFFFVLALISVGFALWVSMQMHSPQAAIQCLQSGLIWMTFYMALGFGTDYILRMVKLRKFLEEK